MKVRELKALIQSAGMKFNDCVTKDDLKARARMAAEKKKEKPSATTPDSPAAAAASVLPGKIGTFQCIVKHVGKNRAAGGKPDLVVVFFHGYNATSENFAPLANAIGGMTPLKEKKVTFVFPQAAPKPEWWPLDVLAMMSGMMGGPEQQAKIIREQPGGLDGARTRGAEFVKAVCKSIGVPLSRVVIAGFSQGATYAIDTALQLPEAPAGIAAFSPFPMVVEQWGRKAKAFGKKMNVFLCHGRRDPVIPFMCSSWISELFKGAGCKLSYHPHTGVHDVGDGAALAAAAAFLSGCSE
eukprot:g722.t1